MNLLRRPWWLQVQTSDETSFGPGDCLLGDAFAGEMQETAFFKSAEMERM